MWCKKQLKQHTKGTNVILWGPCNAGKTCLFYRLGEDRFASTCTSMMPNQGNLVIGKNKYNVLDLPGNHRLISNLDNALEKAGLIVFVLDASTLKSQIASISQSLYELLTKPILSDNNIPVIVACNKQDDTLAVTDTQTCNLLENELERLRKTRSTKLMQFDAQDEDNSCITLGIVGSSFKFDHLDHSIEFISCSALSGNIQPLQQMITHHMH